MTELRVKNDSAVAGRRRAKVTRQPRPGRAQWPGSPTNHPVRCRPAEGGGAAVARRAARAELYRRRPAAVLVQVAVGRARPLPSCLFIGDVGPARNIHKRRQIYSGNRDPHPRPYQPAATNRNLFEQIYITWTGTSIPGGRRRAVSRPSLTQPLRQSPIRPSILHHRLKSASPVCYNSPAIAAPYAHGRHAHRWHAPPAA